jgi:hypothetical protein
MAGVEVAGTPLRIVGSEEVNQAIGLDPVDTIPGTAGELGLGFTLAAAPKLVRQIAKELFTSAPLSTAAKKSLKAKPTENLFEPVPLRGIVREEADHPHQQHQLEGEDDPLQFSRWKVDEDKELHISIFENDLGVIPDFQVSEGFRGTGKEGASVAIRVFQQVRKSMNDFLEGPAGKDTQYILMEALGRSEVKTQQKQRMYQKWYHLDLEDKGWELIPLNKDDSIIIRSGADKEAIARELPRKQAKVLAPKVDRTGEEIALIDLMKEVRPGEDITRSLDDMDDLLDAALAGDEFSQDMALADLIEGQPEPNRRRIREAVDRMLEEAGL